ncbi:hypothetical protein HRI_001614900 [Hibiscus trionum]|uniref:Uncharacterized protein n=1 Tax=Hibiscus trionum TaxID=183268 RepID=A0A9W7HLD7_HIBTR|nr:hypothetical protein HRI_001614900 [Hibiscus trionum]
MPTKLDFSSHFQQLHTAGHYQCFPIVLGFRKNGEVLLQVHDGEMASLDLNSQQMEPQGVLIGGGGLTAVDFSYVESLVLLDKGIDVPAIDSSDSAEWSGEESDMA